jgi:hypothetical protein
MQNKTTCSSNDFAPEALQFCRTFDGVKQGGRLTSVSLAIHHINENTYCSFIIRMCEYTLKILLNSSTFSTTAQGRLPKAC